MQINRLFEIVYLLLGQSGPGCPKVKARDLAERFEVSERTIYRDIDTLSAAGIPVYTQKGRDGGIALLDHFVLDRSLLSGPERESILFSLRSLQTTRLPEVDAAIQKLGALFAGGAQDWVEIDFAPWGCDASDAQETLSVIRSAILGAHQLRFHYVSAQDVRTLRTVEPLQLQFKAHSWYLHAWDIMRDGLRMFRLSRISSPELLEKTFDRTAGLAALKKEQAAPSPAMVTLELRFRGQAIHRVLDDMNGERMKRNEDGSFDVTMTFPEDEWVYGYLLSFGDAVEVLAPAYLRELLRERAKKIVELYQTGQTAVRLPVLYCTHQAKGDANHMEKFCQSCAMPLNTECLGTEKDGSPSADYCKYCYEKGAFTFEGTMEQMIETCVPIVVKEGVYADEAAAREAMMQFFPQLKRWKQA